MIVDTEWASPGGKRVFGVHLSQGRLDQMYRNRVKNIVAFGHGAGADSRVRCRSFCVPEQRPLCSAAPGGQPLATERGIKKKETHPWTPVTAWTTATVDLTSPVLTSFASPASRAHARPMPRPPPIALVGTGEAQCRPEFSN